MNNNKKIIIDAENNKYISRADIISILKDSQVNDVLFAAADKIRKHFVGNDVHLRALIEFSNICKCHCKYCGLRAENNNIDRYKLDENTIFCFAKNAVECGYKTVVLQSGENNSYPLEQMVRLIKRIKTLGVAVTLSLGEKTFKEYKEYKDAGADRFLLRIETTDENLYRQMHPYMSFKNRLQCLYDLKELGYEVGTGCLVGLPGQTIESLADDILFFKKIDADMIGIGPFIPSPNTPLSKSAGGTLELSLKVMAFIRILLRDINIPATTAMETLNSDGRIIALQSGANVIMPNVMDCEYVKKYEIYPKSFSQNDTIKNVRNKIVKKIEKIGRTVSDKIGQSGHFPARKGDNNENLQKNN